ncbi:g9431 [Coccomyxa elongata]
MPPTFNRFSDAELEAGSLSQSQRLGIFGSGTRSIACGALTYAALNWRQLLAEPLQLQSLNDVLWGGLYIENALGFGAALYFGLLTLHYLAVLLPQPKPAKWVKGLKEGQRALLANARRVAVGAAKPQIPAAKPGPDAKPATPQRTPTPLGPPLRAAKPIASPVTPQQQRGDAGGGAFGSPASLGSGPGYSTRMVSTPEQLQRYMDSFEASTRGAASPEPGYGPYTGAPYGYGATVTDALPLSYGTAAAGHSTPSGASVPIYRPSLQPRGKAGSPHRGDGRLSPSSQETLEAVLARLQTGGRTLEVWTEQLRSWLAAELLQPLDRLAASAQKDVINATAALGMAGMQLSGLDAENDLGGNTLSGSAAATAGTSANTGRSGSGAPEADEALLLAQLREQLLQRSRQLPSPPDIMTCLKAVNRYQQLAALLRGEQPRSLLPPTPRGYVAARLRQLAASPVLAAFAWNGGGTWGGKPWSPELPTDSALLLYLFAAFLAAPKWEFALEDPGQSPQQAGPLFLGALPPRPPPAFSAILSFRPSANALSRNSAAILELGMASSEPHFTLVLGGEPVLTLCNHNALFHIILLFLQNAKLSGGGLVGDRSLDYLKLSAVLKPGEPVYSVFSGRWFGLW